MSRLQWDQTGERYYETGVDRCVLYPIDNNGAYSTGYAWNGITAVNESPSGAEATPLYADNIKYLNLIAAEDFGATIEAYTYPDQWAECDGSAEISSGVMAGQQARKTFGLCYRTKIGNDVDGQDHGYKLHLIYGALASPSERSYQTVNDSPEAITFSWTVTTTPVPVSNYKPTACITIDSTKFIGSANENNFNELLDHLYGKDAGSGSEAITPHLPMPNQVVSFLTGNHGQ